MELAELFMPSLMSRSREKWNEGLRTPRVGTILLEGKPITEDFLLSTYCGGEYYVITMENQQRFYITAKQPRSLQNFIRRLHLRALDE